MKLIIAIINRDDANAVTQNLSRKGFSSTRLSTTGASCWRATSPCSSA